jgi:hypothetical protein
LLSEEFGGIGNQIWSGATALEVKIEFVVATRPGSKSEGFPVGIEQWETLTNYCGLRKGMCGGAFGGCAA